MSSANGTSASAAAGPVQRRLRANAGASSRPRIATTNARDRERADEPGRDGERRDHRGGAASGAARRRRPSSPPKMRASSNGRGGLQLVVAAVRGRLVRPPAAERRPVAEPVALEVVVGDLDDPLRPQRLPRQVLAPVPAARRARAAAARTRRRRPADAHSAHSPHGWPSSAPSRSGASSSDERRALVPRERADVTPDVVEVALVVEQAEQQAPDVRARARSCATGTRRRRSRRCARA